jgi:hypothetical protein
MEDEEHRPATEVRADTDRKSGKPAVSGTQGSELTRHDLTAFLRHGRSLVLTGLGAVTGACAGSRRRLGSENVVSFI